MSSRIIDPIKFGKTFWPDVEFYDKQKEIIYSVMDNDETVVPAGNMLGKDFVSAFIALWFFCSRRPARVVTTSVKFDQLNDVLWGEIRRFIQTAKYQLPIQYNHMRIRQVRNDGTLVPLCELVGQVVSKGESMLGRHLERDIARTLIIFDEASGIDDEVYNSSDTWAHKKLVIGNPYPCANFFYRGVKEGPRLAPGGRRKYREVIRIRAEDSPNVARGLQEERSGAEPSDTVITPGVLSYGEYRKRRDLWDAVRQCIGLDADFYEGAEVLMFPPEWLNRAETLAGGLAPNRAGLALGVDPAEGGDKTAMAVVDRAGLIYLTSRRTRDTSVITGEVLALARRYGVEDRNIVFDRGGGGKEHADRLRAAGHPVRTVAFGESVVPEMQRGMRPYAQRFDDREERYVYKNRRAEMYGQLRQLLDPASNPEGFGLPVEYTDIRQQLSPVPLQYDAEGRVKLPPKNKPSADSTVVSLVDLIGHSPDEADALVLAVHGMMNKRRTTIARAI